MFSACTTAYYRALLTGAPPGPGATLANIYNIYTHVHTPPKITYCTIIGHAALGNNISQWWNAGMGNTDTLHPNSSFSIPKY